ncbi:MAG: HPr kinase/phosphatase C-terminal domain-containing protein, partial [Pseudomonadota bacterium]
MPPTDTVDPETLPARVHASAVAVGTCGVLIRGASGVGKSTMALRMIAQGAVLVADDYCDVVEQAVSPVLSTPSTIAGMIEARGTGLLRLPVSPPVSLGLVIELVANPNQSSERLPPLRFANFGRHQIPLHLMSEGSRAAAIAMV